MAEGTLHQVQRLVEQLSPSEQAHLLVSLALRLAQVVTSTSSPAAITPSEPAAAWEEFFRLGDALAASDTPGAETLTAAVLAMRGNAMYTVDASVWVNAFDRSTMATPFGGFKLSGSGRDRSPHAIDKYCDLKTIWTAYR